MGPPVRMSAVSWLHHSRLAALRHDHDLDDSPKCWELMQDIQKHPVGLKNQEQLAFSCWLPEVCKAERESAHREAKDWYAMYLKEVLGEDRSRDPSDDLGAQKHWEDPSFGGKMLLVSPIVAFLKDFVGIH